MMIPKKRVSSGNCLHLRRELDSTYKRFRRAQRSSSAAGSSCVFMQGKMAPDRWILMLGAGCNVVNSFLNPQQPEE